MKPATMWPLAVVLVLAATVGVNVWMIFAANDPNGAVIEPDYYRKAVEWDSTLVRRARSDALGWTADATIGATDGARAHVRVTLTDSTGAPVTGAAMALEAVHNLDGSRHPGADLPETGPGVYEADAPLDRPGMWELRLTAKRQGAEFLADLRRDAARGPAR